MTIYNLLHNTTTNTATYYNTSLQLNLRRSTSVDWTRKAPEAGTRIIGQVAGHEIHLEIEDVPYKIK